MLQRVTRWWGGCEEPGKLGDVPIIARGSLTCDGDDGWEEEEEEEE